jgi:hypothetical protein
MSDDEYAAFSSYMRDELAERRKAASRKRH